MCYKFACFRGNGQTQRVGTFSRNESIKIDRFYHETSFQTLKQYLTILQNSALKYFDFLLKCAFIVFATVQGKCDGWSGNGNKRLNLMWASVLTYVRQKEMFSKAEPHYILDVNEK